jgi:hypothetical protein
MLSIKQLENWLDSFNGITPMQESSQENWTNEGEIVVQLINTMRENCIMKEGLLEINQMDSEYQTLEMAMDKAGETLKSTKGLGDNG